ncbi:hypothetical protein [Modestobacter italicus]|uniref:hypothetical protein n=1 Tax=Modestobacter italicus (strain DSM 44449 / CECT 9708 / BC 501) TaxID=2732864 RepID=UPI001C95B3E2|nr:hypothetical protein [Modestobacter italicus]
MGSPGQAVDRSMRRHIRPRLETAGFQDFTARRAWRRRGDVIDVVDFQAVGAHAAASVGCTPFSFSVRAGVRHQACVAADGSSAASTTRPGYEHCTFQVLLGKRLRQPDAFRPWGTGPPRDRSDIWAVEDDASNVEDVVADAGEMLLGTGLPILTELGSPDVAYAALLSRDSTEPSYGLPGVAMPGAPGSPRWVDTVRCLAVRLGRNADDDLATAPVLDPLPEPGQEKSAL